MNQSISYRVARWIIGWLSGVDPTRIGVGEIDMRIIMWDWTPLTNMRMASDDIFEIH